MKEILEGMKSYIIVMLLISSIMTIVSVIFMFIFESNKTIADVLDFFWTKFYFTGSLHGGAAYKLHIIGLIFFGLINLFDKNN